MKTSRIVLILSVVILLSAGIGVALYFYFKDSFKKRLIRIAKAEASKWKSITELSEKATSILIDYWKAAGFNFSASQMQNSAVQSKYPWSSAFISWLFYKAVQKTNSPTLVLIAGTFNEQKKTEITKTHHLEVLGCQNTPPKLVI